MKIKFHYTIIIAVCAIAILSCKKDNYKAPSVILSGALTYKGEPLQFQNLQIGFQLYQYGFGNTGAINETINQDGTYSALLFAGNYKFTIPSGQVPFKWNQTVAGVPDSVAIALTGNQSLNIEVVPYWMIRTPKLSATGGNVTAVFKAEQIVTDVTAKTIDQVSLFLNKTQFVSIDGNQHIAEADLGGGAITDPANISLTAAIPTIVPAQNYIFARIGLKLAGIDKWIFSPVQKISF